MYVEQNDIVVVTLRETCKISDIVATLRGRDKVKLDKIHLSKRNVNGIRSKGGGGTREPILYFIFLGPLFSEVSGSTTEQYPSTMSKRTTTSLIHLRFAINHQISCC